MARPVVRIAIGNAGRIAVWTTPAAPLARVIDDFDEPWLFVVVCLGGIARKLRNDLIRVLDS